MVDIYIERRLKIGEEYFSEREALNQSSVLVVLAEPGAGKTQLLAEFGRILGVSPVRASRFRHQTRIPEGGPLIIDALDEAAKINQSAVDEIIVKAQEFSSGQVIFATRSIGWQQERTVAVRDSFGIEPALVRIEPLTQEQQRAMFGAHLPEEDFNAFSEQTDRFDLTTLLGNPQFLLLFADAFVQSGRAFTSKAQIFRDAVDRLALDTGSTITGPIRPPIHELTTISAEIMTKLLLSGAAGVSVKEQLADRDYPYLPAMYAGNAGNAHTALDTRLFKPADEPDYHEPVHRIVAEYCAAQYLVHRLADKKNPLSLRRLMAVVAPSGVVRDELRGLLGWMAAAGPDRVQLAAIDLDPYAILANGDPSQLTTASKRRLLLRLASEAEKNPGFRRSDYWRRFSVGGFFTPEVVPDVARLLRSSPVTSPLVDLLLELLVNSGGPKSLEAEVRAIMLHPGADEHTRVWASRALIKLRGKAEPADLAALVTEASANSLKVATDLLAEVGLEDFNEKAIHAFLRAYVGRYPARRSLRDDSAYMASYYLKGVMEHFTAADAARHLDLLTDGLSCSCKNPDYDCRCRNGVSKVSGKLLDRYFETSTQPHDPDRIWGWMRSLWYEHRIDSDRSEAIKALAANDALRHQLHVRAFANITKGSEAWNIRYHLSDSHHHAGLAFRDDDDRRMADFAFESDNPGLWSAFWTRPREEDRRGPDEFRRHLRAQAASKPAFGAVWARNERGLREMREKHDRQWRRRSRRWKNKESQKREADRSLLEANLDQVKSGNHWGWAWTFAQLYLSEPDRLSHFTDDMGLVEDCLRNCLTMLRPHMPSLADLAGSGNYKVAHTAFVSCWLHFRDRRTLQHVDRETLTAAKVECSKYQSMSDAEHEAFELELDRLLFPVDGDAEAFARQLVEPGLSGSRESHTKVWWLARKAAFSDLRGRLSVEWLRTFPSMPVSARDELFNIAAATSERTALLDIVEQGVQLARIAPSGETIEEAAHRMDDLRFWQIRRFFFQTSGADGWSDLSPEPDVIFAIADKAGRFGDEAQGWPTLSAEKIFKVLDAFIDVWPAVHLPSSYGSGDPPEEQAYRFLTDIVWRIGRDAPEKSIAVLDKLLADPRFSGFEAAMKTIRAEAIKKLALASYSAPLPREIGTLLDHAGIASVEDLRAFAVEELGWLQSWLRTADTDPLAPYYQSGKPVNENTARNRVVDGLQGRMHALGMPVVVEHHMNGSNRCDFTVSASIEGRRRLLVVEAKGQWHPNLYTAASTQLAGQYASHQDAEDQGIYLVFWFGPETAVANRVRHGIKTARELQERIVEEMPAVLRGQIDLVVLDLSLASDSDETKPSRAASAQ